MKTLVSASCALVMVCAAGATEQRTISTGVDQFDVAWINGDCIR